MIELSAIKFSKSSVSFFVKEQDYIGKNFWSCIKDKKKIIKVNKYLYGYKSLNSYILISSIYPMISFENNEKLIFLRGVDDSRNNLILTVKFDEYIQILNSIREYNNEVKIIAKNLS